MRPSSVSDGATGDASRELAKVATVSRLSRFLSVRETNLNNVKRDCGPDTPRSSQMGNSKTSSTVISTLSSLPSLLEVKVVASTQQ